MQPIQTPECQERSNGRADVHRHSTRKVHDGQERVGKLSVDRGAVLDPKRVADAERRGKQGSTVSDRETPVSLLVQEEVCTR